MSVDPDDGARDDGGRDAGSAGAAAASPFARGARVGVEQIGVVAGRLGTHSMGHGELLAAPQVGALLELRIRGTRGLASSRIRSLRVPVPGYLLAATERSVYLVALPDLLSAGYPDAVTRAAVKMVHELEGCTPVEEDVTQYVRLGLDVGGERSVLPRGPVFASVETAGDSANKEVLGQCELLSPVVPGSPLRLSTADGRVLATSDVVSISKTEAGEFCVGTGNSVYVIAPILA